MHLNYHSVSLSRVTPHSSCTKVGAYHSPFLALTLLLPTYVIYIINPMLPCFFLSYQFSFEET
jgi:hypothetical protein